MSPKTSMHIPTLLGTLVFTLLLSASCRGGGEPVDSLFVDFGDPGLSFLSRDASLGQPAEHAPTVDVSGDPPEEPQRLITGLLEVDGDIVDGEDPGCIDGVPGTPTHVDDAPDWTDIFTTDSSPHGAVNGTTLPAAGLLARAC